MKIYQDMLEAYKLLAENVEDLTDEQIDELITLESDLDKSFDALISAKKFYAERKKIAEQNEKLATRVLLRIMKQQWVEKKEWENWKAAMQFTWKFDTDMGKLPKELLMANHMSITAKLNKWESIEWVVPTDKFPFIRVY